MLSIDKLSRRAHSERRPAKLSKPTSQPWEVPLTFSAGALDGLRRRLAVDNCTDNFTFFDAEHFDVEVSNISLLDQLAKGSYGVVYKGALNGLSYAVKIEDFLPGVEEQINLLVELTILQSLKHDRLVSYFGSGYLSKSSSGAYKVRRLIPCSDL